MLKTYNLIVITGATAGSKTSLAANLAYDLKTEIISADSRQIYKKMDIGTGKDLEDYEVKGSKIPYHLIDICEPGYKYNVYEYKRDFFKVYNELTEKNLTPILCGGTGLYINAVLNNYELVKVPINEKLRIALKDKTIEELEQILRKYKDLHNRSDLDTIKRAVRAIEIAEYYSRNEVLGENYPEIKPIIFGVYFDREQRRSRITERLKFRLENGMIAEAQSLLDSGVSHDDLEYYGLEYKFLSWYLKGKITYAELFTKLNTAIHQFSKRQMTWFRKMEKDGAKIIWIDGNLKMEEKLSFIKSFF
ncbi:MAG: tRNA (adenosine(37)-N6)-dimethylallyltransferase MiaA [Bacteroidales bacterium]|jgi:tRNA dimethylallyltransferase|nr:tRNA (adenosine(37)-N6)-dimethylallyltransferase MiaA [Bacteroidales bacterium]MCK9499534.1 tRNA (adenosine(37)-N6)-dimethylallyltransferase MiaA [Bacteroidales bacterium]MDY0315377.1 tRNA (adenosine(37)-N6)-dimethylallyltransferase MiaA [Bacteroidales bacterium]NLB86350.1 tRNA (adenosine(37)-N6)-dimethylallyltransferase MiaA [Bacteroidales bacterium]